MVRLKALVVAGDGLRDFGDLLAVGRAEAKRMLRTHNFLAFAFLLVIGYSGILPVLGLHGSQSISSYGTVGHPNTFVYQGTNVARPHLWWGGSKGVRGWNYVPNAFDIIKDLGINTLLVFGGPEGGSMWNLEIDPSWAENLDEFLSLCSEHGLRVIFQQLGTPDNHMLGIHAGEDIALSKSKVDMLGGNNRLGKNFLTDPRIAFWILENEPDLGDENMLRWCQEMGDYFKEKGAKVAACSGAHVGGDGFSCTWIPLIRDHSTHLVIHHYHMGVTQEAQDTGVSWIPGAEEPGSVYEAAYHMFNYSINDALSVRGDIPPQNIVLGEFGLYHGKYTDPWGRTWNFTEETRGEYYRAAFQACKDAGIGGVFPFYLFDTLLSTGVVDPFGAVALDGTYYTKVTDQYKAYYSTPRLNISAILRVHIGHNGLNQIS